MAVKEVERGRSTTATATATAEETLLQGREELAASLGQRGQEGSRTEAWLACWKSAAPLYSVGCSPPKIQSANVSVVGALRAGSPASRAANSISFCAVAQPRFRSLHTASHEPSPCFPARVARRSDKYLQLLLKDGSDLNSMPLSVCPCCESGFVPLIWCHFVSTIGERF